MTATVIITTIMRITIRLTFRDFLGISMSSLIYKSRARTIYCRIGYLGVKKVHLQPRMLDEVSDFRKNALDIGQILLDSPIRERAMGGDQWAVSIAPGNQADPDDW